MQRRLDYDIVFGDGPGWCWFAVVGRVGPFRYLYLPFGPSLDSPQTLAAAMADVRERARGMGCAFVRFEPRTVPSERLEALGASPARRRQHDHTMVLRIDGDEAVLWRGVKSGHRSGIRGAPRRALRVECTRDPSRMGEFVRILRETEQRASFFTHEQGYFDAVAEEMLTTGDASLYLVLEDQTTLAGALVYDFGETRYYPFGASTARARELQAAPALLWRTILDAREMGKTWFDFWGVAPPGHEADHPWAGITYFKGAFGARTESYAGTWELPARPLAARLSSLVQSLRR